MLCILFQRLDMLAMLVMLLQTVTSALLQPEYSLKVLNTENIILSLGETDLDKSDDLEIIKTGPETPELDQKLHKFHKFVNMMEVSERPIEKLFDISNSYFTFVPRSEMSYPDSPFEIAVDPQHLSMLERRRKKKKRHRWKKNRKVMTDWEVGKREVTTTDTYIDKEIDYLEQDYQDYVAQSQKLNKAYKYSDEGKPEENLKDVIKKITDLKTPQNCTNVTGIGLTAMECVVKNFRDHEIDKKDMLNKASIIVLVWFGLYLVIAIPLWCSKGWCCCCFRCSVCHPNKTVKEIQTYIAQNPPGVYVNKEGEEEHYDPNIRETELYESIKRSIAEF